MTAPELRASNDAEVRLSFREHGAPNGRATDVAAASLGALSWVNRRSVSVPLGGVAEAVWIEGEVQTSGYAYAELHGEHGWNGIAYLPILLKARDIFRPDKMIRK